LGTDRDSDSRTGDAALKIDQQTCFEPNKRRRLSAGAYFNLILLQAHLPGNGKPTVAHRISRHLLIAVFREIV